MRYLALILFLFFALTSFAQKFADKEDYLVDSLILEELSDNDKELLDTCLRNFKKAKNELAAGRALQKICEKMMHDDWIKYQFYQYDFLQNISHDNLGKDDSKELSRLLGNALNNIGYYYKYTGKIDKAIDYYNQSLEIRRSNNDSVGMGASYTNTGMLYYNQGNIDKAINYYFSALKLFEPINDKRGMANLYNNLGVLFDDQGDYQKALEYYNKSYDAFNDIENKDGMAVAINNMGFIYKKQNNYSKAVKNFEKALKIQLEIGNEQDAAYSYNNLGQSWKLQGDYEKAREYYQKAISIHEKIGNKKGLSLAYQNMAKMLFDMEEYDKALDFAYQSYVLAMEITYPSSIENSAKILSQIYENQNNYKDALSMYKLHIQMRDSLNNEKNQKKAIQQQAKYEYEKQKAIDDAEHEKEIAIEQEAKEKQTILTYATGGGLGLVGIFLLIVFNRLKVTRKQKNIIEEQKQEVEKQKTVVELAHSELEEKNKEITDSIQYAKRIQNAILPPNKVVKEYLTESFILYKPKDIVAGDFYWLETVSGEGGVMSDENPTLNTQHTTTVLFAAADCTGHGVPGAMVSVVCNNGLNRSVREYGLTDPGKILDKTREIVVEEFEKSEEEVKDGMDIALCSLEGNKLQYAGAHNPLWIIRNGELLETKANKQPIGKFDNPEPYTTHTIELQKGDSVYIFSDGYADQFGGEKGKKLKTANFKKLLLSIQKENMQQQNKLINEAFENWKGNLEQLDDVCVIGVRI